MKSVQFKLSDDKRQIFLYYSSPSIVDNERMRSFLGIDFDNNGNLKKYISKDKLPKHMRDISPSITNSFEYNFKWIFYLSQSDIVEELSNEETLVFKFAWIKEKGNIRFYYIPKRKLGIDSNVFILQKSNSPILNLKMNFFGAGYERRTSIFKKISEIVALKRITLLDDDLINKKQEPVNNSLYGNNGYIRFSEFDSVLNEFPTTTLLKHYGDKIIADNINNAFVRKDYNQIYNNSKKRILQKKHTIISKYEEISPRKNRSSFILTGTENINVRIKENLLESIDIIKQSLKSEQYIHDESFWQKQILKVLPIIYPQYIGAVREAVIPEKISKRKTVNRRLDHILINATGNIDFLEVKCPFSKEKLIMKTKYRDNYIPARELSGGILQIQKYIYYIDHLGKLGEHKFSVKYKKKIEQETGRKIPFNLSFVNPRGILLIGNCEFTVEEQRDFNLIKRQYNNIIDIITYNDLLKRLERLKLLL